MLKNTYSIKKIDLQNIASDLQSLKAGDMVLISGIAYTARDAAHKRFLQQLKAGEDLPIDIKNATVYYAGPTNKPENAVIGSCGPTTSGRMDEFTPTLLDRGLKIMIGKGQRSSEVIESVKKNKALYFAAIGGAGALASECIISSKIVAYEDLGCEAVRRIEFKDFPAILILDTDGNNFYEDVNI
ncbi:MAG: Fe-S-containing hydro-lyase [Clostridia bacterium]|nr:Fe-S-containing hydro-lyase [Clostridia bacterium]